MAFDSLISQDDDDDFMRLLKNLGGGREVWAKELISFVPCFIIILSCNCFSPFLPLLKTASKRDVKKMIKFCRVPKTQTDDFSLGIKLEAGGRYWLGVEKGSFHGWGGLALPHTLILFVGEKECKMKEVELSCKKFKSLAEKLRIYIFIFILFFSMQRVLKTWDVRKISHRSFFKISPLCLEICI